MKISKTVYKRDLLPADSYTVRCGALSRRFKRGEEKEIGDWLLGIWRDEMAGEFFAIKPTPAYVYCDIGWDADDILYCKYEPVA